MTLLCATVFGASAGFRNWSQKGLEAAQKSLRRMRVEEFNHLQQEQGLAPVFPSGVFSFRCVSVPRLAEKEAPRGQADIGVLEAVAQRSGPRSGHCCPPTCRPSCRRHSLARSYLRALALPLSVWLDSTCRNVASS